jgi:chromosome segregation ATPase
MMQNEMNKFKKEIEQSFLKQREIKSAERFSILRKSDNFVTSKNAFRTNSQSEAFNYIENLNIYNDNKAQEIYDLKSSIVQYKEIIDQLKMKLTECKSIISYKENQIRTLESEITTFNSTNKKREKLLKTVQSNLADKTNQQSKTYFILKWTYIVLSIIFICIMIFKAS